MEQMYLYIILVAALLIVAGLAVALYRCRRRLHQCQRAMVRCINENIEMKEKLPEYELPNFLNREDITPEEFTRIIHNMLKRLMFLSVLFPLLLASCSEDRHRTPHPDKGVIAVDVPQGMEDSYVLEINDKPLDEGDNTSDPLPPGEYSLLIYNTPEGFTVTDGIAYVERLDDTRALADLIDPLPEALYSGTKTVTVVADDTLHLDLDVAQRTRDLRLELTVTEGAPERIASITGTLSGVAGAYDLRNETLYGEAVSTAPVFTRSGDKVTADLRLLGTMGDRQTLTLVLTFIDGQTQTTESDLTEVLAGFGSDMSEPFTLTAGLRTPIEAGFSAAITDWEVVDGGHVDIH